MNIVIVEDDINMRKSLEIALSEYEEFKIKSYKSATEALKKLDDVDLIITDINMPGIDGIEFVQACENKYDFIIITGNATLNRAIEAVRLGVKDFLVKPFDVNTLVTAIKRAKIIQEKTSKKNIKKNEKKEINGNFFGNSKALNQCLNLVNKAAKTDASMILFGESGVGKEVFANYIHKNSLRASKPFVAINMAAIPSNLIESELFGFEKGAFTDANNTKIGLFELANEGTLFLDEIGEMPYEIQAKLLRAIQEKEITRLGGTKSVKIDIRIISATNANIEEKIKNNEFRQDLYYRLNTIPINIPPLRHRQDEILQIAEKVLNDTCKEYNFSEKRLSIEAQNALLAYDFPGNIRELISIIQRACILSEGNEISSCDLFLESRKVKNISNLEKDLLLEALRNSNNIISDAAELIGMSEKKFHEKMKQYNIT